VTQAQGLCQPATLLLLLLHCCLHRCCRLLLLLLLVLVLGSCLADIALRGHPAMRNKAKMSSLQRFQMLP
jgi:putative copper export protein